MSCDVKGGGGVELSCHTVSHHMLLPLHADWALDILCTHHLMATEQEELIMALLMAATATASSAAGAILTYEKHFNKTAKNTSSLSGQDWIDNLLTRHNEQFYNKFRLCKHIFKSLLLVLSRDASLHGTQYVSAAEHLCIFLQYAHRSLSNRAIQEQFQQSGIQS